MAKGPKIKDEDRQLIVEVLLEHPDWRAKEIQVEVNTQLRRENPRLNPDWPGLSAIQKELAKIRREGKVIDNNPADKPWSLGAMQDGYISPEALSVLLEAWKESLARGWTITIREAKWIQRLHYVVDAKRLMAEEEGYEDPWLYINTIDLMLWAHEFALKERACEITGQFLDTTNIDATFIMEILELGAAIMAGNIKAVVDPTIFGYVKFGAGLRGGMAGEQVEMDLDISSLPDLKDLNFTGDEGRIYAHLLQYLSMGPKWHRLSDKKKQGVALELRSQIQNIESFEGEFRLPAQDSEDVEHLGEMNMCIHLDKSLLSKVGINIENTTEYEQEANHERINSVKE